MSPFHKILYKKIFLVLEYKFKVQIAKFELTNSKCLLKFTKNAITLPICMKFDIKKFLGSLKTNLRQRSEI